LRTKSYLQLLKLLHRHDLVAFNAVISEEHFIIGLLPVPGKYAVGQAWLKGLPKSINDQSRQIRSVLRKVVTATTGLCSFFDEISVKIISNTESMHSGLILGCCFLGEYNNLLGFMTTYLPIGEDKNSFLALSLNIHSCHQRSQNICASKIGPHIFIRIANFL